jgi:hypothetical protein
MKQRNRSMWQDGMEYTILWRAWRFMGKTKFPILILRSARIYKFSCICSLICGQSQKLVTLTFENYYPSQVITISWSLYVYFVRDDYGVYINTRRTDRNKMLSSYWRQNKEVMRWPDHTITIFLRAEQHIFFFSVRLIAYFLKKRSRTRGEH